ncbi:hypothetical protein, partial [Comamonas jiangduensis]|uniref:hypothetical protein n=1 Tax=Comamonas jiangduensis TaxID=1194168 RepID=UPI003BF8F83F
ELYPQLALAPAKFITRSNEFALSYRQCCPVWLWLLAPAQLCLCSCDCSYLPEVPFAIVAVSDRFRLISTTRWKAFF